MKKILCVALFLVMVGSVGLYSETGYRIKGLIINSSDTFIEVKKGRKEVVLHWTENSKILKDGQAAERGTVNICQKVEATYVKKDGKKELVSLDILSEGYCTK
ncbi:MAG: hypothetical protein KA369_05975 [Spirochaetes bacterium]|nr:hypothetical protein [Spirochaetota bacterium]